LICSYYRCKELKLLFVDEFDFSEVSLSKPAKQISSHIAVNLDKINNISKIKKAISNNKPIYCPVCQSFDCDIQSDYLKNIFKKNKFAYWASVLVTHYRHEHITYYDKSWRFSRYREKNYEYKDYDSFKAIVNNRAKRQIIRKVIKDSAIKTDVKKSLINGFKFLQKNDDKTIELIEKTLQKLDK